MNNTLTIEGNQEVSIKRIMQLHTCEGLLEGLPTTTMNNSIILDAKEEAKRFCGIEEVYVIEPKQVNPDRSFGRFSNNNSILKSMQQ